MKIQVNDAELYFDIAGAGLVPDGETMREKPTLILLHGGPGADHSLFKPGYDALTDVAQIVYLDHRGNGRSEDCGPETWNLAQWGDDVRGLCDALGIEKPIVCGVSFGGFVAQSYATRHPDHIGKLILTSTAARFEFEKMFDAFEACGGAEARAAAEGYWLTPTSESRAHYGKTCLPYYWARSDGLPDWAPRVLMKDDVAIWFNGAGNEQGRMDFRADLARLSCPVLVMAGENDPVTPVAFSETIAAHLTNAPTQFERFANCGHGVVEDAGADALAVLRAFITN
ncbi:MAG: alpha/beta hydrolase [Pseudomonadota bacterium]